MIEPELVTDERGIFRRHFCIREFESRGIVSCVSQGNLSENPYLHTLRGFHFQIPPHDEGKTISCIAGGLYDIIVDLRPTSQTYLKWESVTINAQNRQSIHVPPGCANAYLTLEPNTLVHYYMSSSYKPESYRGFRYDDPFFKFIWPVAPSLISDRDLNWPFFKP